MREERLAPPLLVVGPSSLALASDEPMKKAALSGAMAALPANSYFIST